MLKSKIRKLREQEIISLLNKLRVVDVEMIQNVNVSNLGNTSRRNVLRVLNEMVKDGLLDTIRSEVKLYSVKGRGFGHLEHTLMMNRFLIKNGLFHKARIEPKIKINDIEFIPDFIVPKVDNPKNQYDWVFYEVDRKQKKRANILKIERYKEMGLTFEVVCSPERNYMWNGCKINNI